MISNKNYFIIFHDISLISSMEATPNEISKIEKYFINLSQDSAVSTRNGMKYQEMKSV